MTEATTTSRQGKAAADPLLDGPPVQARTLAQAFQRTVALYPEKPALRTVGDTETYTWRQLDRRVRSVAAGLAALGLRRGDTIAELMQNTVECHVVDYAVSHLGLLPFGIFNSSSVEQIAYQVRGADARVVVTQRAFLPKVQEAVAGLGDLVQHLVVVDGEPGSLNLAAVEAGADPGFDVDSAWRAVAEDDLATLIYTSGTTGPPKAALLSNKTFMSELRAMDAVLPMPREALISFLPMAHIGGRANGPGHSMLYGATMTVCPDVRELSTCLADTHPDALFAPPRFFEKIQVAIEAIVESNPDWQAKTAAKNAIEIGLEWARAQDAGSDVPAEVADRLAVDHERGTALLRPILERLGLDRISAAYIGGAPCAPEIVRFFTAVGVPLLEAYGATEVCLNIFNRVEDFKTGTAGKPLPGVELRLGDDGELLVKSDLNFVGYRNDPEQTSAAIDGEGWVHTGDIARIDDDGFVAIIDRKKEIIINSAGKNMSPAVIESAVRDESSLIGQVVAIGDGRRYVTALLTLDPEAIPMYAARLGLSGRPASELAASEEIRAELQSAVDRANSRLNSNEQIKRFAVLPEAWLPDTDELTPTAKLKRRVIHRKYADRIDALYARWASSASTGTTPPL